MYVLLDCGSKGDTIVKSGAFLSKGYVDPKCLGAIFNIMLPRDGGTQSSMYPKCNKIKNLVQKRGSPNLRLVRDSFSGRLS